MRHDVGYDAGLFASVKRMLATLVALLETRIELVSVELEEQLAAVVSLLLWGVTAIFFGSLSVLLLALTIVLVFWDEHRLLAAGLVTGGFGAICLAAVVVLRRRLRARPRLLGATVGELHRDAATLQGETR